MYCPVCSHEGTKVVDTRIATDGTAVRRRRECETCGHRFSTNEEIELLDFVVVKRDGDRFRCTCEPFVLDEEMRAMYLARAVYEAEERVIGILQPLLLALTQGGM